MHGSTIMSFDKSPRSIDYCPVGAFIRKITYIATFLGLPVGIGRTVVRASYSRTSRVRSTGARRFGGMMGWATPRKRVKGLTDDHAAASRPYPAVLQSEFFSRWLLC